MLTFKVAYLLWVFIFVAVQTKATNGRSFFFSNVRFKFHSLSRRLLVVCHTFLGVCVGGYKFRGDVLFESVNDKTRGCVTTVKFILSRPRGTAIFE